MFTPNSSRQTLDAYFKSAMMYDLPRLQAVMQGKDSSIPQAVAMMAMQVKKPLVDAAKAQQAGQQPKPPSVKENMQAEAQMMPEGAGRPQQMQQGQLPEQAGIGALPAQNMKGMGLANGGIIAFSNGGDTELFGQQPGDEVAALDANQISSALTTERSSFPKGSLLGMAQRGVFSSDPVAENEKALANIDKRIAQTTGNARELNKTTWLHRR
jgi:hypothetical protein